jgi:hypothetical protein
MGFYSGDTYNFILNIPSLGPGTPAVTTPPLITILDITAPGSPIVSGAAMTFMTGTSFLYYYSFSVPNASPKDYVAIYSYVSKNTQSLGSATAATWTTGIASYTFPLPLPPNTIPGNGLTTVGFTSTGTGSFNVTNAPMLTVNYSTGVITVAVSGSTLVETGLGTGSAVVINTVSNQLLESTDKLHIGDSYITGPVALNATVAQNATVAKDATVMKTVSYVAPMNDPVVQNINTNVTTILADSSTTVSTLGTLGASTISGLLQDVYDNVFGSWNIDQTANPPVLYIKRINGTPIASFQLVNNNTNTQRNVLTSPPESSI